MFDTDSLRQYHDYVAVAYGIDGRPDATRWQCARAGCNRITTTYGARTPADNGMDCRGHPTEINPVAGKAVAARWVNADTGRAYYPPNPADADADGKAPGLPAAADFLSAAKAHMRDRATTYDQPDGERSMGRTVAAFNIITGHALTEEQGWLFLGLLKKVRSQQGKYRADNYEDEAAYAALRGECAAAARNNGGRK